MRPVTTTGETEPVPVIAPGLQVAVYPVIVAPPFDAGAVNAMEACPLPAVATPIVGAPGTFATITIEKLCVVLPPELVAVTTPLNVPTAFGVPLMVPAELRVRPPGSTPVVTL